MMNNPDRCWMYARRLARGDMNPEFYTGVEQFLEFACSQPRFMDGPNIRCPCKKCQNRAYRHPEEVRMHLLRKGFVAYYFEWRCHGEPTTLSSSSLFQTNEVVRMPEQNAKNRRDGVDDDPCPSTHNGGSIPHSEHGKILEQQYSCPPTPFEIFRRTHTKKGDGETFTNDKAHTDYDQFAALVEERSNLGGIVDENSLYYEAAGGTKKKRVFGLGSQGSYYYDTAGSQK